MNEPRLTSFAARVASLFDWEGHLGHAYRMLAELETPAGWQDGPLPGTRVRVVRPGPRVGEPVRAMFVALSAGRRLPAHRHHGPERALILAGGFLDSRTGQELWAGELVESPAGSSHTVLALPPRGCIAAVLLHGGVSM